MSTIAQAPVTQPVIRLAHASECALYIYAELHFYVNKNFLKQ